jgi:hypothetical protein
VLRNCVLTSYSYGLGAVYDAKNVLDTDWQFRLERQQPMPSFQAMFFAATGQPIEYKGELLRLVDLFPLDLARAIRVEFERTNSEWRQGIALDVDGELEVNGQKLGKSIVLWENTAPKPVDIQVIGACSHVTVHNVWDSGRGTIDAWHHGAAMIVHDTAGGRCYRCNDGHPDDNFDDVVFCITRVYGET